MMLVSDRIRKEVVVLLENIDSRKGMSAEELRDVVKTGLVRYHLRRHPLPAIFAHTSPRLFATINNETSWEV